MQLKFGMLVAWGPLPDFDEAFHYHAQRQTGTVVDAKAKLVRVNGTHTVIDMSHRHDVEILF